MKILGIETSCDESAVCLIDAHGDFGFASPTCPPKPRRRRELHAKAGGDFSFQVLGNSLISQIAIHAQYGGVFPNLAKREHAKNLVPLLEQSLKQGGVLHGNAKKGLPMSFLEKILEREPELHERLSEFLQKYARPEIDAIAVTVGPGLEPALWVGINCARALALVWNIPIVAVNHMEGHIVSALIADTAELRGTNAEVRSKESANAECCTLNAVRYPMLSLLISGGHTELVLSTKWHDYKILGATRDDAVGEAFDKVARLLGLPYPGGPSLSALAERARNDAELTRKNAEKIQLPQTSATVGVPSALSLRLPRPMMDSGDMDFSFAGLKTAVLRIVQAHSPLTDEMKSGIALEFENAVTDVLVAKTLKAVDEYGAQTVVVGGGVSANKYICSRLAEALEKAGLPAPLVPTPELATDNALMIALAGYFRLPARLRATRLTASFAQAGGQARAGAIKNEFADPAALRATGNLKLA